MMDDRRMGGPMGERKMYSGNWNCAKCQSAITELPFEPDPSRTSQLLCRNCHRERQQQFGPRRPRFGGGYGSRDAA